MGGQENDKMKVFYYDCGERTLVAEVKLESESDCVIANNIAEKGMRTGVMSYYYMGNNEVFVDFGVPNKGYIIDQTCEEEELV